MLAALQTIHRRAELLEHALQILEHRYDSLVLPEDQELLKALRQWKEWKDPDYRPIARVTIENNRTRVNKRTSTDTPSEAR